MTPALLLVGGLLLGATPASTTTAPQPDVANTLAAYKEAEAHAGRGADAQVKLALWCEAHGLSAERIKHLALAVLLEPSNATARGLMGLVAFGGRWTSPDQASRAALDDPARAKLVREYLDRRASADDTADSQWKLALWCEQNGLAAQAVAHLHAVVRLDPGREAAWKRLGYRKQGNRWVTPEQLAAEKAEAEAQKQAARHWRPLLEKWRSGLDDRSKTRHDEALAALDAVSDPRAVPSVWAVFGNGNAARQAIAVRVLARIDGAGASRALAVLAIFGRDAEVRRAAAEALPRRDPREFADLLVGLLRDRIEYKVNDVGGPGVPGQLLIQGKKANVVRVYTPPVQALPRLRPGDVLDFDEQGLPVILRSAGRISFSKTISEAEAKSLGLSPDANSDTRPGRGPIDRRALIFSESIPLTTVIPVGKMALNAERATLTAQARLSNDIEAIDQWNAEAARLNERVIPILTRLSGHDLGEESEAWRAWATDLRGYAYVAPESSREPPTLISQVPIAFQPQAAPVELMTGPPLLTVTRHSCFGAGTLVRTLRGPRPIETIEAGDQVLAQDPTTGALSYRSVVTAYHNPPNATLRVRLGDEDVVVTGIHRFWKAGHGWIMARELKPGDTVRTLGGTATVAAVEDDIVQPVFNLELADGCSFFVGQRGALVHDNSLVEPVAAPFDAPPTLAALERGSD